MKRSKPLRRKKPLAAKGPIGRSIEKLRAWRSGSKGLAPISPRREAKRKARKVRGPLQEYVRGRACIFCGEASEPAHVESVGSGRNDFARIRGKWVGRIAPLCAEHHRRFDSRDRIVPREIPTVAARIAGETWMRERDVDPWSDDHPYVQIGWASY